MRRTLTHSLEFDLSTQGKLNLPNGDDAKITSIAIIGKDTHEALTVVSGNVTISRITATGYPAKYKENLPSPIVTVLVNSITGAYQVINHRRLWRKKIRITYQTTEIQHADLSFVGDGVYRVASPSALHQLARNQGWISGRFIDWRKYMEEERAEKCYPILVVSHSSYRNTDDRAYTITPRSRVNIPGWEKNSNWTNGENS